MLRHPHLALIKAITLIGSQIVISGQKKCTALWRASNDQELQSLFCEYSLPFKYGSLKQNPQNPQTVQYNRRAKTRWGRYSKLLKDFC